MKKPNLSGRTGKWAIALSSYDIRYQPRSTIKSQALADFVADFSPDLGAKAEQKILQMNLLAGPQVWKLYVDGSSNSR